MNMRLTMERQALLVEIGKLKEQLIQYEITLLAIAKIDKGYAKTILDLLEKYHGV